jgi:hypothetical protein
MASLAIIIKGIDKKGRLILSDKGKTVASPGDTITWIVNGDSGVAAITAIIDDSKNDVFHPDPVPTGASSWQGTINKKPGKEKKEIYTINYLKIGDATIHRHDPEIQVKPKP